MSGDYKFDTLSLHAGHVPDERHGSRAVPIHQTTSYVFKDTEHAAALYNMEFGGNVYFFRQFSPVSLTRETYLTYLGLFQTLSLFGDVVGIQCGY